MSTNGKRPYAQMLALANELVEWLRPACQRIEIAGSLRRQRPLVGDVELVAVPILLQGNLFGEVDTEAATAVDALLRTTGGKVTFIRNGPRLKSFTVENDRTGISKVDLFLVLDPEGWGPIMTIRTGSADFSHWLVSHRTQGGALPSGFRFMGGRLTFNNRALSTPEEKDVFGYIGLDWVAPEKREKGQWGFFS